jgi:hypothetical protein
MLFFATVSRYLLMMNMSLIAITLFQCYHSHRRQCLKELGEALMLLHKGCIPENYKKGRFAYSSTHGQHPHRPRNTL